MARILVPLLLAAAGHASDSAVSVDMVGRGVGTVARITPQRLADMESALGSLVNG